mgnify:FL=1
MKKASLYHIQLNVSQNSSLNFYKEFLEYLGYKVIDKNEEHIGLSNGTTDFWIILTDKKYLGNKFHRKSVGLNHLAFRVDSRNEVDDFAKNFLKKKGINLLYNSPRDFPEYWKYYAVYFEDPDRMKLEVVYVKK